MIYDFLVRTIWECQKLIVSLDITKKNNGYEEKFKCIIGNN
uniref:Uncharacterized protein n=1 Tax=Podoviridae sp. ct8Lf7 TaxID=2827723 RepID=A0A8S5S1C6_9CAUD|nr:MAG TPA: hypothetical protein [Podoviridae sp. ct8Lf7]